MSINERQHNARCRHVQGCGCKCLVCARNQEDCILGAKDHPGCCNCSLCLATVLEFQNARKEITGGTAR